MARVTNKFTRGRLTVFTVEPAPSGHNEMAMRIRLDGKKHLRVDGPKDFCRDQLRKELTK